MKAKGNQFNSIKNRKLIEYTHAHTPISIRSPKKKNSTLNKLSPISPMKSQKSPSPIGSFCITINNNSHSLMMSPRSPSKSHRANTHTLAKVALEIKAVPTTLPILPTFVAVPRESKKESGILNKIKITLQKISMVKYYLTLIYQIFP